jgi:hypothetical protein
LFFMGRAVCLRIVFQASGFEGVSLADHSSSSGIVTVQAPRGVEEGNRAVGPIAKGGIVEGAAAAEAVK